MEKKTTVGIVGGLGHIGLIQAACLAKLGYKSIAYDINSSKVKDILRRKMPFYEPGLEGLVRETMDNGLLHFTAHVKDLQEAEMVFICTGTPALPSGEADTSQVYFAVEEVARHRSDQALVIIKSTVPTGTCRKIAAFLQERNLAARAAIISCPEFLREGSGVQDFREPSRIVVGAPSCETAEKVAGLYSPPGVPVLLTTWENAELIKHASNAFLASKISFINEIALLCEQVGADIRVISKGIGLDPRINPYFLEAGVGFSGPCLEKDLKSLLRQFQEAKKEAKLLEAVLWVNEEKRGEMVRKLQAKLGDLRGRRIAVLGMAFKPQTDDVRDSHSLPIIKELLSAGASITVHDPWIKSPHEGRLAENDLPGVEWASSPYTAAQGKDALLILTAWPEYRKLDLNRIKDCLSVPLVLDGRNIFESGQLRELGIDYQGVGV
jgi:UDPglucose 6-dehydrogenase